MSSQCYIHKFNHVKQGTMIINYLNAYNHLFENAIQNCLVTVVLNQYSMVGLKANILKKLGIEQNEGADDNDSISRE